MNIESLLAARAHGLSPSPIRKLAPLMRRPGMISLGGGYPHPATFAFERMEILFRSGHRLELTGAALDAACQYTQTDCFPDLALSLRAWHEAKDGVAVGEGGLQVLDGAQEGLHTLGYLLLEPGDPVVISEPAYPGALAAFRAFTTNLVSVPVDGDGTVTSELERRLVLREREGLARPKLVYEVPNGHNPAGVSLSLDRRRHLLDIAKRFDLLVLEDDPYELLQLEPRAALPTLQSLDTDGRVLRLDSFSKIFAPGLRIGYATGPAALIHAMQLYKQGTNLHTSSMSQAMLAGFLAAQGPEAFRAAIARNCEHYRTNRDLLCGAVRTAVGSRARFNVPKEGMFLWIELPTELDATRMVETDGLELGLLLVPGSAFSTTGGLRHCMRASFSMLGRDTVDEAARRLAEMVRRETARAGG
jgi:DNA-binding transcriptional MocR family regulator